MTNSLAAQAVAHGPATVAPPSFNGHGWLVALNLAAMTAATLIALWMIFELAGRLRRTNAADGPLVRWLRVMMLLFSAGICLRCGAEALSLWGWDPTDPADTGWYLTAKRFIDPIAVACGVTGLGLFVLVEASVTQQLRKKPWPERLRTRLPMLWRPLCILVSSMVAAVAVVSLR